MTEIDVSTTLADLVNMHPELARELERRSLDYCCGGSATLADACEQQGLDASATARALTAAAVRAAPADWTTMDAATLVDHIEATHHRYLWDELPRVTALVDKIVTVHGARHPELADIAARYAAIRADLEPHMLKEERVLFPMIRELVASTGRPEFHCGTLRNPISVMLAEHDAVGDMFAGLRRITDDYAVPGDGCATYRMCFDALEAMEADTHLHIHKENNVLFPLVVRLEAER